MDLQPYTSTQDPTDRLARELFIKLFSDAEGTAVGDYLKHLIHTWLSNQQVKEGYDFEELSRRCKFDIDGVT